MPVNWPPTTFPVWPPVEIGASFFTTSDLKTLLYMLKDLGFTQVSPTTAERNTFFKTATCDDGHAVIGRMLVSPNGSRRYPFAVCNNATHRELLVLWPPYTCGFDSGVE